jgi:hypothetical protein
MTSETAREPRRIQRKPKFKIGQVVSVRSFYGNFSPGETGPGFQSKIRGWKHGWQFGKIVKLSLNDGPPWKATAPHCYFLDGWSSAQTEDTLRPLTKREIANI